MKTVQMLRDFNYCPTRRIAVAYLGGVTYPRVPEAAVRAIIKAGAGEVVTERETETDERPEL
jgi:hypothetical protein